MYISLYKTLEGQQKQLGNHHTVSCRSRQQGLEQAILFSKFSLSVLRLQLYKSLRYKLTKSFTQAYLCMLLTSCKTNRRHRYLSLYNLDSAARWFGWPSSTSLSLQNSVVFFFSLSLQYPDNIFSLSLLKLGVLFSFFAAFSLLHVIFALYFMPYFML